MLDHLAGVSVFADEDFADYGLDEPRITDLRNWVTGWYDDLSGCLAADFTGDETSDLGSVPRRVPAVNARRSC